MSSRSRSFTAILFLGDRSPYGLSVARALIPPEADGPRALHVKGVVAPTRAAWERASRRALRHSLEDGMAARAARRLRRAITGLASVRPGPGGQATVGETGQPLPDDTLDPGITGEAFEMSCAAAGVGWRRVDDVRSIGLREMLSAMRPDLFLSAAFPLILPDPLLAVPGLGSINFHPSLLPRCRGCHPIFWTLASGETQGGVTAHWMTSEVDAGDIVAQIPLPLTEEDGYVSLYRRAMDCSPRLVRMVEEFLLSEERTAIPQDHSRATSFHEDTERDHRVHWSGRSPAEIAALVRTGMAFTLLRGERLGILAVADHHPAAREKRLSKAGRVVAVHEDRLVVAVAGGAVELLAVTWRGRAHRAGELARAIGVSRNEELG
ncbi:MAG: methionyl-tRNA formyltransferase [Candidatus Polarisedimenticolia bacterium]